MTEKETGIDSGVRVGEVARGMLDGSIHYLKGAIELASLRHDVGAYENDPDFFAFVAVLSEIQTLPLGVDLGNWTDDAIACHQEVLQSSIEWVKTHSLSQCQSLAQRYPPP